jgi:hypothetical protein
VFDDVTYRRDNSRTHRITSRNSGTADDEIGVFGPSTARTSRR